MEKSWIGLVVMGLLAFAAEAQGATINAASCSQANVQAAVNAANHGDTVQIPAGTCSWSTTVSVDVGITLQGAGQAATTLRDNVTKNGGSSSQMLSVSVNMPNNFRLTNMRIEGQAPDPSIFNKGHIQLAGTMTAFRLDHIIVVNPQTSWVLTDGCVYGLIDHITFTGNKDVLSAIHEGCGNSNYGDGSFVLPIDWGGPKAIYVEDSTFVANSTPFVTNFFDGYGGQRVVIRHNSMTQGNVTSHGTDSSGRRRGSRHMEVYNNSFSFPSSTQVDFLVWIRGGTGVVFNNIAQVLGGLNHVAKLNNCRDSDAGCGGPSYSPWGACNGSSPYDQNASGGGYRCVDQPGSGTSRDLGGAANPSAQAVGNALDPIYVWNNTTSEPTQFGVAVGTNHVQQNRDYFVGIARPGYTPYTYPHPLSSGIGPLPGIPSAPANLRISQ